MHARLGDVLVRMGVLTAAQRDEVLGLQASSGRPFGALAEEMFGVSTKAIERAWAAQYSELVGQVDLAKERSDTVVHELVERRQAWQFQLLPLRFEDGHLLMATTEESLPRAMRFVAWALGVPASFVIADENALVNRLQAAYPMPGGLDTIRALRQSA